MFLLLFLCLKSPEPWIYHVLGLQDKRFFFSLIVLFSTTQFTSSYNLSSLAWGQLSCPRQSLSVRFCHRPGTATITRGCQDSLRCRASNTRAFFVSVGGFREAGPWDDNLHWFIPTQVTGIIYSASKFGASAMGPMGGGQSCVLST